MKVFQPFHLVTLSTWPLFMGAGSLGMVLGLSMLMFFCNASLIKMSLGLFLVIMIVWWRDVIREGTYEGSQTESVEEGLVVGMLLFILSELCFLYHFF